jgi:hypothetical protein
VELLLRKIQSWFPLLKNTLIDSLNNQKKQLFSPETFKDHKPLISRLWDIFLIGMILYFLLSIINMSIQHQLVEKKIKNDVMRRSTLRLSARNSSKDK